MRFSIHDNEEMNKLPFWEPLTFYSPDGEVVNQGVLGVGDPRHDGRVYDVNMRLEKMGDEYFYVPYDLTDITNQREFRHGYTASADTGEATIHHLWHFERGLSNVVFQVFWYEYYEGWERPYEHKWEFRFDFEKVGRSPQHRVEFPRLSIYFGDDELDEELTYQYMRHAEFFNDATKYIMKNILPNLRLWRSELEKVEEVSRAARWLAEYKEKQSVLFEKIEKWETIAAKMPSRNSFMNALATVTIDSEHGFQVTRRNKTDYQDAHFEIEFHSRKNLLEEVPEVVTGMEAAIQNLYPHAQLKSRYVRFEGVKIEVRFVTPDHVQEWKEEVATLNGTIERATERLQAARAQ